MTTLQLILAAAVQCLIFGVASSPPATFDWRTKGVVAPVVSQGQLGRSDIFTVVEAIQSYNAIQKGRPVRLSVLELQDCCKQLTNPYICVLELHGLCSLAAYPRSFDKCHSSSCQPIAVIKGYRNVMSGDENGLMAAVLVNPVSATINAGLPSFQLYKNGIYDDAKCTAGQLDHSVLVVGYGTMNGEDYWICQNSWGSSWGMQGYILIARNKGNRCGIASAASYPV